MGASPQQKAEPEGRATDDRDADGDDRRGIRTGGGETVVAIAAGNGTSASVPVPETTAP